MNWTVLEPGSRVHGRYRVEKLLGRGGFGAAYLCSDLERFEKPCVLKQLRPDVGAADKAGELFVREAKVLLSLSHPSIPAMHAFFEIDERYYLVQELVDGETLDHELREHGVLPEERVLSLVVQVLQVLSYLHARTPPVIHRDIKPSNLIVDGDGRLHLIDLGAVLEAMSRLQGTEATIIGTPGYTPLEQSMGTPVPSSDIYALGATALQLLTGTPPVEWHDPTTGRMTSLSGRAHCSVEFELVLAKMLAEFPDERYRTAEDVIEAITGQDTVVPKTAGTPGVDAEAPSKVRDGPSGVSTVLDAGGADVEPTDGGDAVAWPVDTPGARAGTMKRAGIGAGVLATVGAVWFIAASGVGGDSNEGQRESDPPTTSVPVEVLQLPLVARTRTSAGLNLSVRYPASWQLTTTNSDTHIAVRDPGTGTVFLTGMEQSQGPQGPPSTLAARLAADPGENYGQIAVTEVLAPVGGLAPFRLDVLRGVAAEQGTLVIQQFTTGDATFSLWWMTLGNDSTTTPTVDAMAQTLTTDAN